MGLQFVTIVDRSQDGLSVKSKVLGRERERSPNSLEAAQSNRGENDRSWWNHKHMICIVIASI